MCFRLGGLASVVLILASCGDRLSPPRAEIALLAQNDSVEALEELLITRQRTLFSLVTREDRRRLSELLDVNYTWQCNFAARGVLAPRCPQSPSVGSAARPTSFTYYHLLNGAVPPGLDPLPYDFKAEPTGRTAKVTSENDDYTIITYWRFSQDQWTAVGTLQFPKRR